MITRILPAAGGFLACALLTGGGFSSAAPLYEVTILPFSSAGELNNAGQIAGIDRATQSAILWENGVSTTLASMPSAFPAYSTGQDIVGISMSENGMVAGQIVGALPAAGQDSRAVLFSGIANDLGALPGSTSFTGAQSASARAINNSGVAVGNCTDNTGTPWAVIYSGGMVTKIGAEAGSAVDINNNGQIVGNLGQQGFIVSSATPGAPATLAPLLGHALSEPRAINEAGIVAGRSAESNVFNDPELPVIWNNGGAPTALAHFPGADLTRPTDLNQSLEMVGTFRTAGQFLFAPFYYDGAGTYHNLNDVLDPSDPDATGLELTSARAINDNGWIIARGTKTGMGTVGVLLKPAPPVPVLPVINTSFTTNASGALTSFSLSVPSQPGSAYQLRRLTTGDTAYSPVGAAVPGTGSPLALTDPAPPADTAIYRISEETLNP